MGNCVFRIPLKIWSVLFVFLFVWEFTVHCQGIDVTLSENHLIWDKAAHNGFTTIESFEGYLYCAFREASLHRSYDGEVRLIRSKDGNEWESVHLFKRKNEDFRDPELVVIRGNLYLMIVSRTPKAHFSYTYIYKEGKWEQLDRTVGTWRWKATKHGEDFYSVAYSSLDKTGNLYINKNDQWESIIKGFFPDVSKQPNEGKLFFMPNDKLVVMLRQEKAHATFGYSEYPYKSWTWKDFEYRIGGPSGMVLDSTSILACIRVYDNPTRTSLFVIDVETGVSKELITIAYGWDTGYSSIVLHDDQYYLSYYSTWNPKRKTSVYLAKLNISKY